MSNSGYLHGGDQTIIGTEDEDVLGGFTKDDTLVGLAGNDTLRGDTDRINRNDLNNSFEFHDDFNRGSWGLFTEVNGWKRPDGAPLIELQRSGTVGTASDGNTVLELDSTANSIVYRDISGLDSELTYTVSFDYSARPRVSEASNGIEVYWDGVLIFSDTVEGRGLSNFDWQAVSIEVPVTSDTSRLEFRASGTSDSLGVTIDNVGVYGVDTSFDPAVDGGNDLIDGAGGDDIIEGGAGDDALIGGEGADDIDGGTGERDIVSFKGSAAGIIVDLEAGTGSNGDAEGDTYKNVEFVHGSMHDDVLTGDEKTNRLVGLDGDDVLSGGAGNDTLLGGKGADQLDGGEGDKDVAEYDWSSSGVIVNLETGIGLGGHAHGDVLTGIEYIYGSYYADILTGNSDVNRLVGDRGDDVLNGGAGNDILVGGEGADELNGGSGARDAADYGDAESGVTVDLVNGGSAGEAAGDTYSGVEFVYGSDHDDVIIGDAADNRLVGAGGNDQLSGGEGKDYLVGGEGADDLDGGSGSGDTAVYKSASAGVGVDLLNGGFAGEATGDTYTSIEYVDGSDFDDTIIGDGAQNRLVGQAGNDTIDGGAGNDYIIGMQDNDILTGGAGADVFLYKALFGDDVITDFEGGVGRTDRIWLDLDGINAKDDLNITDTTQGANIEVAGYGNILLENVLASDLVSDDFIF